MTERNFFDNDLRSRFEGFAPEPPIEVWPAVRDAIVVAPRRNLIPLVFRVAAAIAFLAIGGLSVWFLTSDQQASMPMADFHTSQDAAEPSQAGAAHSLAEQASAQGQANIAPAAPSTTFLAESLPESGPDIAVQTTPSSVGPSAYPEFAFAGSVRPAGLNVQHAGMLASRTPASADRSPNTYFAVPFSDLQFASATNVPGQGSGIILGLHVSPQYNDRHIAQAGSMPASQIPFASLEKNTISYGYGLSASIPLSSRFSVQTGIGYSQMNQMISNINVYAHYDKRPFYDAGADQGYSHPQNIMTSLGMIQMSNPALYFTDELSERVLTSYEKYPLDLPEDPKLLDLQSHELTQAFSFIEIPLIMRYRVLNHRHFGVWLKAGVAGNFMIRNDVLLNNAAGNHGSVIGETFGVRDFSYSGIGGFSLTVPVFNRFSLFVEPTAQMFMQPIVRDDANAVSGKTYPYSFSVYSGISYRF